MLKFIGDLSGILGIIGACSAGLISILAILRKDLRQTIRDNVSGMEFGLPVISAAVQIWLKLFINLFGSRYLSWKMLFVTPFYTLIISTIVFFTWFVNTNFHNILLHGFKSNISPLTIQSLKDYYLWSGLLVSIFIDLVSISMTKKAIQIGLKYNFVSIRFALWFSLSVILSYIIFDFSVYKFRNYDMIRLYKIYAPDDLLPEMSFEFFPVGIDHWVNLLNQTTIVHETSRGWFSTYFMPEPVIFYCAVMGQVFLLFMTIPMFLIKILVSIRKNFVKGLEITGLISCTFGLVAGFVFLFLWLRDTIN